MTVFSSSEARFHDSEQKLFRRTDKLFFVLMGLQWIAGIIFALVVSPRAWSGAVSSVHVHVYAAIFLGGLCCLVPMYFCWRRPGHVLTRHVVAVGQTAFSSLLIHLTGGRIETHFHVFGSLAFLACYRDWRVIITATVIVASDHLVRGIWYPMSVYGVLFASPWRVLEHALWVVFEDVILIWSCRVSRADLFAIAEQEHQNCQLMEGLEHKVQERTIELQSEVSERRRAESAVRANEERYRTLVENSPQIIIKVDRDSKIQFINRTVEGLPREKVVGASFFNFHPAESHDAIRDALQGVFEFGQRRNLEMLGPGPSGKSAWYSMNLAPLHTEGEITEAIVLATDVTERHQSELELIKARDLAEAGNRAKSEFLATMSHELRTPMNGVIGFAHLLMDTPLNGEQKEFAQTICSSGESLLAIINDILDLSKIESGKFGLDLTVVNFREIVEEIRELMLPRATAKGIELATWFDPASPVFLKTDQGRIRQILLNLVGNGLKFTEKGRVVIEVRNAEGSASPSVRIGVRDTGIGIPEEKHTLLFQKFSQVDGSSTRRFGGTGLGLAISKQLVELLGGAVGVESALGRGSYFWFTHPANAPQPNRTVVPEVAAPVAAKTGATGLTYSVLLAEDNPVNQRVAALHLKKLGCQVTIAANGSLAVEQFQKAKFDGIFMDLLMPDMDGFEATKTIRSLEGSGSHIPIVALTANAMPGDRERCHDAGMDDYVAKPIQVEELRRVVNTWLASAPTNVEVSI